MQRVINRQATQRLVFCLFLLASLFNTAFAQTFTAQISGAGDDAEEAAPGELSIFNAEFEGDVADSTNGNPKPMTSVGGAVSLSSSDLELVRDHSRGNQLVGLRFAVDIPASDQVTITNAYIEFIVADSHDEATTLQIVAERALNASAFGNSTGDLSSRQPTGNRISWRPSPWEKPGDRQRTPNLKNLVQEITEQPKWPEQSHVVFLISGQGKRVAKAFSAAQPSHAARLHIDYIPVAPLLERRLRITAGARDAEESTTGDVDLNSSDLELVRDGARGDQWVGLRYEVDIAGPAVVQQAYLQFTVDEADSRDTRLSIRADSSANAKWFEALPNDLSSRRLTLAMQPWSPPEWPSESIGAAGVDQRTPDVSAVVQEVLSHPNWQSENRLALILFGSGKRIAKAYSSSAPQNAAELVIRYAAATPYQRVRQTFANLQANHIFIAAHRGGYQTDQLDQAPGNSLANIENAIKYGFDIYESDIEVLGDGTLVVFHDNEFDALTNTTRANDALDAADLTYMKTLRLIYLNAPPGQAVSDEEIPTLREFLSAGKDKIFFKFDLKSGVDLTRVLEVIEDTGTAEQVLLRTGPNGLQPATDAGFDPRVIMPRFDNPPDSDSLTTLIKNFDFRAISFPNGAPQEIIDIASTHGLWVEVHEERNTNLEDHWLDLIASGVTLIHSFKPQDLITFLRTQGRHW